MNVSVSRVSVLVAALTLAGATMAGPQTAPLPSAAPHANAAAPSVPLPAEVDSAGARKGMSPRAAAMARLDANQDGMIDRSEAAARPRLASAFDTLDINGDGKLERAELRAGHPGHGGRHGGPAADGTGRQRHAHGGMHRGRGGADGTMFAVKLDADGDGRISKLEAGESRLGEQFATIDSNRDGYLVRSELRAHAERRRQQARAEHAKRFEERFAQADGNQDGRLSRAELEAAWPRKAPLFAFLDEDRDGYLTRADLAPAQR